MKTLRQLLVVAAALAMTTVVNVARAQDEYSTDTPIIHVTHGSTDSVYWTDQYTQWFSVPSGCTGGVTGTLRIQYIDSDGSVMKTTLIHGYNNPNNGSSLAVGNSSWNTLSDTYSPIDYYNGWVNAYTTKHGSAPPVGTYYYKYKLDVTSTITDPVYGPILNINPSVFQLESFLIIR